MPTNHYISLPAIEKIHPICTIPEKITTKMGDDIDLMVKAPIQIFKRLKISFPMKTNSINEMGATFCQV